MAAAVCDAVAQQEEKRKLEAQVTRADDEPSLVEPLRAAPVAAALAAPVAPVAPAMAEAIAATPPSAMDGRRGRRRVRRRVEMAILVGVFGSGAAAAVLLSSASSSHRSGSAGAGQPFAGALDPVPTSHVNGVGSAVLKLRGDVATVSLTTRGLLNSAPHPLHIHAGGRGICPPGGAARRHNGHLAISTLDGVPYYGPPVTALTTRGDTSVKSILALFRFPTVGNIRDTRRITLSSSSSSSSVAAYVRNDNAVIVVHGVDYYTGNGIYDNTLDRSDLVRSLS